MEQVLRFVLAEACETMGLEIMYTVVQLTMHLSGITSLAGNQFLVSSSMLRAQPIH